jgi:hypothetical protein
VEHVERQNEREAELKAEVDELEQKGDELEERGEQLDQQIGETREEFERKQRSPEVPGAVEQQDWQPTGEPPGDAGGGAPRTEDGDEQPEPRPEEDE